MTALQMSRSTQTFRPQQPAGSRLYLTYSSASMSFVLRKYSRLAGFIEPLTGLPKGIHTEALGITPRSARYVAPSLSVSKGSRPMMKLQKDLPGPYLSAM